MKIPRIVYAIYPHDENGNIVGVYVGSTHDLKRRLQIHMADRTTKGEQVTLHNLMRENGFDYQKLDTINEFKERHLEYDWIAYFKEKTNLKVLNRIEGKSLNHRNCNETFGNKESVYGGDHAW